VAYRIFVPFTAAGQRGLFTPLPLIHPDSDYKDMFPTANYEIHLKQQKADVKKKSPFLRYWPHNEMRQGADEGGRYVSRPGTRSKGKAIRFQ